MSTTDPQQPLDFTAARARRDEGIRRAVDHANAVEPRWADQAYEFLVRYLQTVETCTSEQARAAAAGVVPEPPSRRAWGGPFTRAARAGLIEREGYTTAVDPKVHCNVVTVWRSRVHRGGAA